MKSEDTHPNGSCNYDYTSSIKFTYFEEGSQNMRELINHLTNTASQNFRRHKKIAL